METERASELIDLAEWVGAGMCVVGLYVAGRAGQMGMVLFIAVSLFFILTTRAFRTDRDALLESLDS